MAKKTKTLEDILVEVKELKEEAVICTALANYLRTKYLPRDAMPNPARLSCEGAPVSIESIEEMAAELEERAAEVKDNVTALLSEAVDG